MTSQARVSVIVVSDYAPPGAKTWDDERTMLRALARQDAARAFEVVLAEDASHRDAFPDDLLALAPHARVVFFAESRSARLKDLALGACDPASDLVAIFEADSEPDPSWLRLALDLLEAHPAAAVVSGVTTYGRDDMFRRALALLDRAHLDPGPRARTTDHASANAALWRRAWRERFTMDAAASPFVAGWALDLALRDAGAPMLFHPGMHARHRCDGFAFARDVRRQSGFALARVGDPSLAHVARRYGGVWRERVRAWRRVGSRYVEPRDWPLVVALTLALAADEIVGIASAVAGAAAPPATAYR